MDLIFGVVILLAMARGWSRGLVSTIATYTAPVLGFMIAADMSDPVRDKLATVLDAPDIALDLLAPLVVFIVVVAIVRILAALLARLLGVGLSLPGRVLGAAASGAVLALLIGAAVLMVDEVSPLGSRAARETGTQPPAAGGDPLADLIVDIDRQLGESVLAPQLASLASATWRKVSGRAEGEPLIPSKELDAAKQQAVDAVEREAAEALHKSASDAARPAAGAPAAGAAEVAPAGQAPGDAAAKAQADAAGKPPGAAAVKAQPDDPARPVADPAR